MENQVPFHLLLLLIVGFYLYVHCISGVRDLVDKCNNFCSTYQISLI